MNRFLKQAIFGVAIIGSLLWGALIVFGTEKSSHEEDLESLTANVIAISAPEQKAVSVPVRLSIPKINVDAVIIPVGLTAKGSMDAPKDPADTAWFRPGPRPGEIGSAVISGHYGWKDNIPAVFDSLHTLKKGDKIHIFDESGTEITFIVREVRTFGELDDASEVFGSSDGKAHLNLITCEGEWNKTKKSYANRLVVFSDREVGGE